MCLFARVVAVRSMQSLSAFDPEVDRSLLEDHGVPAQMLKASKASYQ